MKPTKRQLEQRSAAQDSIGRMNAELRFQLREIRAQQKEDYARAEAAEAQLRAVAADMVLVPREPTDAMLDAGHAAGDFHIMHYDGTDKPGTPRYSLRASYKAMLAAAQEKEKP